MFTGHKYINSLILNDKSKNLSKLKNLPIEYYSINDIEIDKND